MNRCFSTFITVNKLNKPLYSSHQLLITLLDSCKTLTQVKQIHAQLITTSLILHPIPTTKLIKLLTESSFLSLTYAHLVFEQFPSPDIFIYNTMIKAYIPTPQLSSNSILIFKSMVRHSAVVPNQYTFVFVLKACSCGLRISEGEQICVHAIKLGLDGNVYVMNVLIKMYADLGLIVLARKVFDGSIRRDLYSWNSMIGGYVGAGDMLEARGLFDEMPERDVVSWSTMVAGYVQVSSFMESMELFHEMLQKGPPPNEFTLVSALAACANLLALDQGKWIHVYIKKEGFKIKDRLLAGLIDMYAKCGEIEFAHTVFKSVDSSKQTIWPWNSMIGGFAMHGRSQEAINAFEQMRMTTRIAPNKVTFISLLNACSHGKLDAEGRQYFKSMVSSYGVRPEIEHYGCMVDLLGRAGFLKEAEDMIVAMPIPPDTIIWGALLAACRIHRDTEMAERIGKVIRESDPNNIGCSVLLANMYAWGGRWTEATIIRDQLGGKKKTPGCTSIELNGMVHQFLVGDRSHPQTEQIYSFLDEMTAKLRIAGYVPEIGEVLLDIYDEEDKETALARHSEKLAIAFGLINTTPKTPIRIMKNLRVCGDCHEATKFISKVYDREIIVRDRLRFHHFRDGICSCKDYW